MAYDEKLARRIRRCLAARQDVEEKKMFGGIALMVRGRMSCGIVGSSLMLRVDPAAAEALLGEPGARPMDFTGRPMRGFLFVDPPGISTAPSLKKWVRRATGYAEALPAKGSEGPKRLRPGARRRGRAPERP